ncbi:MAG: polysaccharide lyase family 1 protein [Prosthecobacter sp.]|uniref:pectate lyase family protein n=1 Tax=Prosthecobacter sp. TaxID=1965333 RepID=UPI0038FE3B15
MTQCRVRPVIPVPLWEKLPLETIQLTDKPPAFAGAEGFGCHTAGGRDGPLLWVENLHDDGPGSFRAAAITRGIRHIAFRVAGEIVLKSVLRVSEPFITVEGSTAPAGGITFTGNGFLVTTHDVVLRHFRIRPGDDTDDEDALSFSDARRCIADHLSLSWSTDEVCSITGLSDEITVQWCIISEGLNRENHGYAAILGGERVTWHHNLMAHHVSRVPRFAGIVCADFRNNVLYNWGHTAGYGQFERVNYIAYFLKPGPSTTQKPPLIHTGVDVVGDASLYLEGNHMTVSEAKTGFETSVLAPKPFAAPPVTTSSAVEAFEKVLSTAGALPDRRDTADTRIVRETRDGTGNIIHHAPKP